MGAKHFLICFALLKFSSACQSTSENQPILISEKTILPKTFVLHAPVVPAQLVVSEKLLDLHYVTRPRADMREGPGTSFMLLDKSLNEGDRVIAVKRLGPWQKVIVLKSFESGWVHHQTLANVAKTDKLYQLTSQALPRIFSLRNIRQAYDFKNKQKMIVDIPRGHGFVGLKQDRSHVLVYLADTNSLLWLSKEEAK